MDVMTVTTIEHRREWTRDDLVGLPDGGSRYEIIDGVLIVSAAPSTRHQRVVLALYRTLFAACPPELEVFVAPLDVVLDETTVLEPDLLVARRDRLEAHGLPGRPELAVEVLSPSSRGVDRLLKFERYQRAGTPAYWIVDPDALTLDAFELRGDDLVQVVHVTGDQVWRADLPFGVEVAPASWLG